MCPIKDHKAHIEDINAIILSALCRPLFTGLSRSIIHKKLYGSVLFTGAHQSNYAECAWTVKMSCLIYRTSSRAGNGGWGCDTWIKTFSLSRVCLENWPIYPQNAKKDTWKYCITCSKKALIDTFLGVGTVYYSLHFSFPMQILPETKITQNNDVI